MKTSLNAGRYKVGSTMGRMVRTRNGSTAIRAAVVTSVLGIILLVPELSSAVEDLGGDVREVGRLPAYAPFNTIQLKKPLDETLSGVITEAPLIINPSSRRGYQFVTVLGASTPNGQSIDQGAALVDLDTRKRVGSWMPVFLKSTGTPGIFAHAVDEQNRRLFMGAGSAVSVWDEARLEKSMDPVIAYLRAPPSQPQVAQDSTTGGSNTRRMRVKGLSLFRNPSDGRQKLLLAIHDEGPSLAPVPIPGLHLAQWDVERAIKGNTAEDWGDWIVSYPDCVNSNPVVLLAYSQGGYNPDPMTGVDLVSQVPVGRSAVAPYAYLGCAGTQGMKAVRVRLLGPNQTPDFTEVFQGPSGAHAKAAFFDPQADRLHLIAKPNSESVAHEVWTFDMLSGRLAGRSGLTNQGQIGFESYGFDSRSGRIYAVLPNQKAKASTDPSAPTVFVQGALMVVEGRLTPVPQALAFPQFQGAATVPVVVDPAIGGRSRRIYLRRGATDAKSVWNCPQPPIGQDGPCPTDKDWLILEDAIPVPSDPDIADLDRYTVNIEEKEGSTGSSFEGSGAAYAARLRMVRGISGALTQGNSDTVWAGTGPPTCWFDDRVFTAAPVEDVKFNSYQNSSRAAPIQADSSTKRNQQEPASSCPTQKPINQWTPPVPRGNPNVDTTISGVENTLKSVGGIPDASSTTDPLIKTLDGAIGQGWGAPAAECLLDGQDTKTFGSPPLESRASVTCGTGESKGEARASLNLAGIVRVADGGSSVTVRKHPTRGVEVRSEAWVSGVSITLPDSTLRIDKVSAMATVWSNGRPSVNPRGSYVRTICGVRNGDDPPTRCYQQAITDAACKSPPSHQDHKAFCKDEMAAVVSIFNRVTGIRGSVHLDTPDFKYVNGSPGGYVVAVQKSLLHQFEDAARNGDFSYELPALEIIIERPQGREIIQLAAVKAASTYGIYQLPKELAFSDDSDESNGLEQVYLGFDSPDSAFGGSVLASPSSGADRPGYVSGGSLIKRFFQGLLQRALLFRSFKEGVLAAAVWLSLLLPAVLVTRRMAVLRSIGLGS